MAATLAAATIEQPANEVLWVGGLSQTDGASSQLEPLSQPPPVVFESGGELGWGVPPGLEPQQSQDTGFSQGMHALEVSAPSTVDLSTAALSQFVEAEVIQHFEIVQAASRAGHDTSSVAVCYPGTWAQLRVLLLKLAYDVSSEDNWIGKHWVSLCMRVLTLLNPRSSPGLALVSCCAILQTAPIGKRTVGRQQP